MTDLHVVFRVGEASYAVAADLVQVMDSYDGATPVPGTPHYVAGLVQIRGDVVPVVDLRARFGLPAVDHTLDHRVLVVRVGQRDVGLLVDAAREVMRLPRDTLREPPEAVAQQGNRFVKSITRSGERLLMIIDAARVIGEEELNVEQRSDSPG